MTTGEVRSTLGTTADTLHEAARLMRERAVRSIGDEQDTPRWVAAPAFDPDNNGWTVAIDWPEADWDTTVAQLPYDYEGDTAPHVASWHPAVALAVATWLDACALVLGVSPQATKAHALAVARAYLGESA